MGPKEIRVLATTLRSEAKSVLFANRGEDLKKIPLTDPTRSAQSFRIRYDELSWIDLIIFHITTRKAKEGDIDAICELPRQLRIVEREYC